MKTALATSACLNCGSLAIERYWRRNGQQPYWRCAGCGATGGHRSAEDAPRTEVGGPYTTPRPGRDMQGNLIPATGA